VRISLLQLVLEQKWLVLVGKLDHDLGHLGCVLQLSIMGFQYLVNHC